MKHIIKYLIFALLLYSCEEKQRVSESFPEINEFSAKKELPITTTTKSHADSKETFKSGDTIYVYGFSKSVAGASTPVEGRNRFMPAADGTIGAAYGYYSDLGSNWYRFKKVDDVEMGFWRTGQYHDFTAYYYDPKPTSADLILAMDSTGLPKKELLWGQTKDVFFSGQAHIIPEIRFEHKLSRIRVEIMHDMDNITTENFTLEKIQLKLDKSGETFNMETGTWKNPVNPVGKIKIVEAFDPSWIMDNIEFPKLTFVPIADLWVQMLI